MSYQAQNGPRWRLFRARFLNKPLSKPHADVPASAVCHSISKGKNRYNRCNAIAQALSLSKPSRPTRRITKNSERHEKQGVVEFRGATGSPTAKLGRLFLPDYRQIAEEFGRTVRH